MRIEIVSTGDEIITGSIDDTNASFLSQKLAECGLEVIRRHTTGDNLYEIEAVLTEISQRESIVLVTGGLGPTNDDLTTLAVSHVANVPLCFNHEWFEHIVAIFKQRGRVMTESNRKQAMLPQGCKIIDNPNGTACGFMLKINKATFIFAPGVPKELKSMWHICIKDLILSLIKSYAFSHMSIRKFYLIGIGESNLADIIKHFDLPEGILFGDRAALPLIELKLIGRNVSPQVLDATYDLVYKQLERYIVCTDTYNPIKLLTSQQIYLPKLHIVDLASQGTFALELQKLNFEIRSVHVINLENYLSITELNDVNCINQLLLKEQIPNAIQLEPNSIYLMPSIIDTIFREKKTRLPFCYSKDNLTLEYILKLNLIYTDKVKNQHTIKGTLLISLADAKPSQRVYMYISSICIAQITRLLTNKTLLQPEDCKVELLDYQDYYNHS